MSASGLPEYHSLRMTGRLLSNSSEVLREISTVLPQDLGDVGTSRRLKPCQRILVGHMYAKTSDCVFSLSLADLSIVACSYAMCDVLLDRYVLNALIA